MHGRQKYGTVPHVAQGRLPPLHRPSACSLITKAKQYVPEYCRIVRVIRDIPAPSIEAGSKVSNLRQVIHKKMQEEGLTCRCIRCREIGNSLIETRTLKLKRINYDASGGKEIFLSYENAEKDKLAALLRLRIPPANAPMLFSALKEAALIREIHTYGKVAPLEKKKSVQESKQHKGLGKKLLKEAERIAQKEFGMKKMAVIAGAGVRGYYAKLGYKLRDTYMVKNL